MILIKKIQLITPDLKRSTIFFFVVFYVVLFYTSEVESYTVTTSLSIFWHLFCLLEGNVETTSGIASKKARQLNLLYSSVEMIACDFFKNHKLRVGILLCTKDSFVSSPSPPVGRFKPANC
jgi:hypothetical protein